MQRRSAESRRSIGECPFARAGNFDGAVPLSRSRGSDVEQRAGTDVSQQQTGEDRFAGGLTPRARSEQQSRPGARVAAAGGHYEQRRKEGRLADRVGSSKVIPGST